MADDKQSLLTARFAYTRETLNRALFLLRQSKNRYIYYTIGIYFILYTRARYYESYSWDTKKLIKMYYARVIKILKCMFDSIFISLSAALMSSYNEDNV